MALLAFQKNESVPGPVTEVSSHESEASCVVTVTALWVALVPSLVTRVWPYQGRLVPVVHVNEGASAARPGGRPKTALKVLDRLM